MKRESNEELRKVQRCFPLGWTKCIQCGKEFKFEKGWLSEVGPYFRGSGRVIIICSECAPTREKAVNIAKGRPPLRGPAPPPLDMKGFNDAK